MNHDYLTSKALNKIADLLTAKQHYLWHHLFFTKRFKIRQYNEKYILEVRQCSICPYRHEKLHEIEKEKK